VREERGRWYLLTGVILGIVMGLAYAWLVSPREYRDTSPASLRGDFKDQYRALIAAAFVANGNLPRARARLDQLGDADVTRALAEQAQRSLAEGDDPRAAQALGLLAVALGQEDFTPPPSPEPSSEGASNPLPTLTASGGNPGGTSPASLETVASPQGSPESSSTSGTPVAGIAGTEGLPVTRTPLATGTPLPTRTPTPTPGSPFALQEQTFVCEPDIAGPLLQVIAEDAAGNPLPGVEVVVNWEGGEDRFFTGLKPELGAGYADFLMTQGVEYTLQMAGGGESVSELSAAECSETSSESRYWGSWLLVFERP
jgi:hypothetical protein